MFIDSSSVSNPQSFSSNTITITTGSSSLGGVQTLQYSPPPITFSKDYVKSLLDMIEADQELSAQFARIIASTLHNE
jgi:hypothetical protein